MMGRDAEPQPRRDQITKVEAGDGGLKPYATAGGRPGAEAIEERERPTRGVS